MTRRVGVSPEIPSTSQARLLLIGGVLLVLAAILWLGPWRFTSPVAAPRAVAAWVTDTTPIRGPNLKAQIQLAGFTYYCSDCHKHFPSPPETTRSLTQHQNIELKHGINTRCFNCHHLTNRDAFMDDWGREIPFDQPQLVCAKCHGPVYRDWLNGSHGRTNGYWDTTKGPQQRRKCVECHDPHQPPFPPMHPAPAPETLRMGDQKEPREEHRVHNPLKVYGHEGDADRPAATSRPKAAGREADR